MKTKKQLAYSDFIDPERAEAIGVELREIAMQMAKLLNREHNLRYERFKLRKDYPGPLYGKEE